NWKRREPPCATLRDPLVVTTGVPVLVKTNTSPFELVATPAASPRWMFGGRVSGVDASYAISGMFSCADTVTPSASVAAANAVSTNRFMDPSPYRLDVVVVCRR